MNGKEKDCTQSRTDCRKKTCGGVKNSGVQVSKMAAITRQLNACTSGCMVGSEVGWLKQRLMVGSEFGWLDQRLCGWSKGYMVEAEVVWMDQRLYDRSRGLNLWIRGWMIEEGV